MTGRRRIDWRAVSRRAGVPFLLFVVVTWSLAAWHGARRPEPDLLPFLKRAWPMADFERLEGGAWEVRRRGELVGHAAWGRAPGYAGAVVVALGADAGGQLASAAFLEYRDTPDLLRRTRELLGRLLGRPAGEPLRLDRDVDAVTGATFTSRAVVAAANEALAALPSRGAPAGEEPIVFGAAEATLLLLMLGSVLASDRSPLAGRARRAAHAVTQIASLATIGFLFDRPWTIAFPIQLATGEPPSWRTHLYGYLLLAYLLLVFARSGRSPYCPSICPFGAAQDLVGRLGGARRRPLPAGLLFLWIKRGLLWAAVLLGLLHQSPGAASYEVFGTAFRGAGSGFQIAVLGLVGVVAVFFARPFCHWLCPVDVQERFLRAVRRRWLGRGHARRSRPVRLPVLDERPRADLGRRLRDGALGAVGFVVVALVVAHLATRFQAARGDGELGRMSETFVATARAR